jgi:DNA-binding IclR family transcriptional regulator
VARFSYAAQGDLPPVHSGSGGLVAAIALSAPADRAEALSSLVDQVKACAVQLGPLVS